MSPDWLPDIINVNGDPNDIFTTLYSVFQRDIQHGLLTFQGLPLVWNTGIRNDGFGDGKGYPEGFWHLIERKNQKTNIREFDPRRAERLPWFSPTILNILSEEIQYFEYLEGDGKINTYVWLKNYDYIIILRKQKRSRGDVMMIMSAYHLDGDSSRRRIHQKWLRRVNPK